eukprot:CAMPEP_0204148956 /NCGR_PEP_ID=MMETSP0361-20130328/23990_1 /ASSEMBLY_ACC=CAM_ASM_000343 /TAXON_ID=268821 /ORGANISM="Scrippsiella Hangoei, Strain SHTV-5" /LENGTH=363 /DNA_ID=CAMNT_0051103385 /DNA_START=12 /DNA_END=1100 /DNA_ORIENTATION=+
MGDGDAVWLAFCEWCAASGIDSSAVSVESQPGRGRCMVASRACAAGECLVMVPGTALIAEGRQNSFNSSHWMLSLVHRLLAEDALGAGSSYAPYVEFLFAGDDPLDLSEFQSLPGRAGHRARYLDREHRRVVGELCGALPPCSPERAARALHCVDTRTVYSKRLGLRALVPVFDFMNHDPQPSAIWELADDRTMRIEAKRDLAAGEEVTIFYDDVPNAKLLLMYGFVVEGASKHQCIDMEFRFLAFGHDAGEDVVRAEVRLLSDGSVQRRALLVPLLRAARVAAGPGQEGAGERLFAEALLEQASEELGEWEAVVASNRDASMVTVATGSRDVLKRFVERLRLWRESSESGPAMAALSRTVVE